MRYTVVREFQCFVLGGDHTLAPQLAQVVSGSHCDSSLCWLRLGVRLLRRGRDLR